jgi:hypothetical protein
LIKNIDGRIANIELVHLDLSGSSIESLETLPLSLQSLKLDSAKSLSSKDLFDGISRLKSLEFLDLSHTVIDDVVLIHILNSCSRLRRLKLSGCSNISDLGIRSVFEICAELELLDFSHNWKVTHNFWQSLTVKSGRKLDSVGVAQTNIAPVFVEPLREFLSNQSGKDDVVCSRIPLESVDYFGRHVRTELDSVVRLRAL